jgi:hypothetical protein
VTEGTLDTTSFWLLIFFYCNVPILFRLAVSSLFYLIVTSFIFYKHTHRVSVVFCLKFVSRFLEFSSNFKIGAKSRIFFFFSLFFLEHSTILALSLEKKTLFFVLCTRSLSSPLHPSPPFDVRSLKLWNKLLDFYPLAPPFCSSWVPV